MGISWQFLGGAPWREHPDRARVEAEVRRTIEWIEDVLPADDLNLVLFPTPNLTDARWSVSGRCHNAHAVEICFNPDHPQFAERIQDELGRAIVHELHHAVRYRHTGPWTVGENLVLEGLAICAEQELGFAAQDVAPLPAEIAADLQTRGIATRDLTIAPEQDASLYEWIWAAHSPEHVTNMYYVGAELVREALENSNETAFSAIAKPYTWFFEQRAGAHAVR